MFDFDEKRFPRGWADMSVDYRLLFVFLGSVMLLLVAGRGLSVEVVFGSLGAIAGILLVVSLRHRIRSKWRWPGVKAAGVLKAVLAAALGLFFVGALPFESVRTDPVAILTYGFLGGMVLFGVLDCLNIVAAAKAVFEEQCGTSAGALPESKPGLSEPSWKRTVRGVFSICFLAVWVSGIGAFWVHTHAHRNGTIEPAGDHIVPVILSGETRYITQEEDDLETLLRTIMMIGIPAAMASAAVIHFIVGVKLFPHMPTLAKLRGKEDA